MASAGSRLIDFGWSTTMSRDKVCVAVTLYNGGASFNKVFSFGDTSNLYKSISDRIDGQPDTFFGWSLDISTYGSRLAIGAPNNSDEGSDRFNNRKSSCLTPTMMMMVNTQLDFTYLQTVRGL